MLLAALAAAVWCSPGLAFIQRGHEFSGFKFGEKVEKGEAEKGEAALGRLSGPAGIAVNDATGDVYVVDAGDQRVERFHPEAEPEAPNPLSVWGYGVKDGKEEFEICTANPCRVGKAGTGPGQFDYPEKPKGHQRTAMAIAVDNSTSAEDPSKGDVYVVANTVSEQNVVDKFSPEGNFLGSLPLVLKTVGGISVDASGVVWVQGALFPENTELVRLETVERFNDEAANKLISTVTLEGNEIQEEPEAVLEAHCPSPGIAIDRAGSILYLNHERFQLQLEPQEACFPEQEEFNKEEKTKLHGVETSVTAKTEVVGETAVKPVDVELDRENTTGIAVDQSAAAPAGGDVYLDNRESIAAFDASTNFIQRFGEQELKGGGGAGIAVDDSTHEIYAVNFKTDHIYLFELEEVGAPIIDSVSAENLELSGSPATATVDLKASIDPHGEATEYFFEYGTSECPTGCTATATNTIPAGFGDVSVHEVITGLTPGTTYFFRVVATNVKKRESVQSSGGLHTFTTLPNAREELPDHRAWELVSPPKKRGASAEAIGGLGGSSGGFLPIIQAAATGNAVTYGVNVPPEEEPEGNRAPETQQIISVRTPEGWQSKDLVPPSIKPKGFLAGEPETYQLFSSETLQFGLLRPTGVGGTHLEEPPLVHELHKEAVTEEQRSIYRRRNFDEEGCETPPKSCYEPLVTPENAPTTANFGGELSRILGASPDLAHVVLRSKVPLVPGAQTEDLYEWNAGSPPKEPLKIVNVLPSNEVHAGSEEEPGLGVEGQKTKANTRNAISSDGNHIIWSEKGHLYTRNMSTGQTIEVSAPEEGVAPIEGGHYTRAAYQTASSDGKRIFFTAQAPLTETSKLDPKSDEEEEKIAGATNPADLYVCELVGEPGKEACKLTDLTVDARGELGEDADVTTQMPGASEDGTSVYFVANGMLAPGAVKGTCNTQHQTLELKEEVCNLYEEHFSGGKWASPKLIAVLSGEDRPDWGAVGFPLTISFVSSRVSPNGQFLAFMSKRPLTGKSGYNEDAVEKGVLDEEVYLYDAARERLVCASCNPSGAKPHGVRDIENSGEGLGLLADRPGAWRGQILAGSIPTWTLTAEVQALYQSRYLTDEGRLFFDSPDQLTALPGGAPWDNKENVFEYEPEGVGTCATSPGCVGLISSGTDDHESSFIDATPDGKNVFFVTAAQLVRADDDHNYDVYDARVCEPERCIESAAANPQQCESSQGCRPGEFHPGAFQFTGPSGTGNVPKTITRPGPEEPKHNKKQLTTAQKLAKALAACRKKYKHHKKKRVSCERSARKHYKAKKAAKGHGAKR